MINVEAKTKLSQEEVIKRAVAYFGPDGYGLKIIEQSDNSLSFEGGGGGGALATREEEGKTTVSIVSREWDYQTKKFLGKIN